MSFLLRKTINSNSTLQSLKPNNTLTLFLRQSTKHFSTETQPPPPPSPPQVNNDPSPADPFLQDSATSLTYARLHGVRKHTLKTDIINLFEGSNLTLDDIRVVHNSFNNNSYAAAIKFTSRRAYDNAQRALTRAGRVYNLEKTPPTVWDAALRNSYDGKTVLLEGLPKNALDEDIERFLSGCEFVPSSIRTFVKYPGPIMSAGRKNPTTSEEKTGPNTSEEKRDPIRMATVLFSTRNEAMNALIKKNRGFCLNNQISVRVLH
ncbi:Ribosomal protein S24e family protein [Salix suchowensis]|nr:Ribosomal protein S24e family protein [Salix suchowensis]